MQKFLGTKKIIFEADFHKPIYRHSHTVTVGVKLIQRPGNSEKKFRINLYLNVILVKQTILAPYFGNFF